jgi:hypothetical protein
VIRFIGEFRLGPMTKWGRKTVQLAPFSAAHSATMSFLLVVVDRRNETRLGLLCWSVERPKTEAVSLGAASKHDTLKGNIARGESFERIFQHCAIGLDSFSHRSFLNVGREDQIGDLIKK